MWKKRPASVPPRRRRVADRELEGAPLVRAPGGRRAVLLGRRPRDEAAAGEDDVAVLEGDEFPLARRPATGLQDLDAEVAQLLARRQAPHLGEVLAPLQVRLHRPRQLPQRHALEAPVLPARPRLPEVRRQRVDVLEAALDVGQRPPQPRLLVPLDPRRHGPRKRRPPRRSALRPPATQPRLLTPRQARQDRHCKKRASCSVLW